VEYQKAVKKHVAAVHIGGKLTLLQRKISNILLFNAYENLLSKDAHQIHLRDLAELAGFDSKDEQLLKDAFRRLAQTTVEWNVLEDGQEEWGVATLLSHAKVLLGRGIFQYGYDVELRKKLFNPEIYARINLSIQRQFTSGYALALYETCVRYKNVGSTGWIDLEKWRALFGVGESYPQFKKLNEKVVKPAIKEVNDTSDIWVQKEVQREKRRIVAMRFSVQENPQMSLSFPQELVGNPLLKRLLDFGVSKTAAVDLMVDYNAERITENLDYVEAELTAGKSIKKVGAYALKAIQDDYRPKKTVLEQEREAATARNKRRGELEAQLAALEAAFQQEKSRQVREAFEALSDEARQALIRTFEARFQDNGFLLKEYRKKGLSSPWVHANLLQVFRESWQPENPLSLETYAAAQGLPLQGLREELAGLTAIGL
jgi:hypothetical protein